MNLKRILELSLLVSGHSFICHNRVDRIYNYSKTKLLDINKVAVVQKVSTIDNFLQDIHDSGYDFRIIVVGNGAILETTSPLGPIKKSSTSSKTGERLVTFASEDQSFEFHVKVDQVKKIVLTEVSKPTEEGEKILRICRLLNESGGSICSLIMSDKTPESTDWFSEMKARYDQHPDVDVQF